MSHTLPTSQYIAPSSWADHWLAEAAVRRGITSGDRLGEQTQASGAWAALLAAGVTEAQVLDLACTVSATKRAVLDAAGPEVAALVPQAAAERHDVVPVRGDNHTLYVATSNPLSPTLERELAELTRRRIHVLTATPGDIAAARRRIYGAAAAPIAEPSSAPGPRAAGPRRPSSSIPVVPARE